MIAEGLDEQPLQIIDTEELLISNKQGLHEYLTGSFANLFFTEKKYVQEKLRIVGPVRLRTIHTIKKDQCSFPT